MASLGGGVGRPARDHDDLPKVRAGRCWLASHPGARSARTIAAVLAVFASTQVAAATLTVRQQEPTGSPVLGSIM